MTRALTISEVEAEIVPLIPRAAARKPAKVLARETELTERHIRGLRQREHQPGAAAFLALAAQCPDLRAVVGRLLGFMPPNVQDANETIAELKRLVASLPDGMGDGD